MHKAAAKPRPGNQLLFLPSIFNETLNLLFEAQNYFQSPDDSDTAGMDKSALLFYTDEVSRITLRLTSAMGWLMVRRAVYAGRIDEAQAGDKYRLEGQEVCLMQATEMLKTMPLYLHYLSSDSLSLYERINRLDHLAYGPN